MSRIAIFSDIHGNLPALRAVMEDISERRADQIYCLGDLVDFAPWTNEVIDLVRKSHITCLMGNHDERVAYDLPVIPLHKHSAAETAARVTAINYTKRMIRPDNKKYLAGLPQSLRLTFNVKDALVQVLLVHASPDSNDEYIYEDHPIGQLQQSMEEHSADVLIMGHTHLSYIRELTDDNNTVQKYAMNCGSVGRSKEDMPLASYLLLDIDEYQIRSEIIKVIYPVSETANAIRLSGIPDYYADFLMTEHMI